MHPSAATPAIATPRRDGLGAAQPDRGDRGGLTREGPRHLEGEGTDLAGRRRPAATANALAAAPHDVLDARDPRSRAGRTERRQLLGQRRDVVVAKVGILLEALEQDGLEQRRRVREHGRQVNRPRREDARAQLRQVVPDERELPGHELVERHAQRPDVRARVDVRRRAKVLGRHVERRPEPLARRGLVAPPAVFSAARGDLRYPEVDDLEDRACSRGAR